jgi:hypothetical protein
VLQSKTCLKTELYIYVCVLSFMYMLGFSIYMYVYIYIYANMNGICKLNMKYYKVCIFDWMR